MKTKILRKTVVSVFVLFGLAMPLAAGTSDGILNFSDNAHFTRSLRLSHSMLRAQA